VLAVACVAGYTKLYGRLSPYIETVSYSATFLFHLIPGITETTTRLPLGAPSAAERRRARLAGGDRGAAGRIPDRRNPASAAAARQAPAGELSSGLGPRSIRSLVGDRASLPTCARLQPAAGAFPPTVYIR